jgi:hypothetical protein
MPADPIHPDQLDGDQQFRADLVAYLDSLPIGELAELLGELPPQPSAAAPVRRAYDRAERAAAGCLQAAAARRPPRRPCNPRVSAVAGRAGCGSVSLPLLAVGCRVDHRRNQGRLEPGTAAAPAVHAELPPGG